MSFYFTSDLHIDHYCDNSSQIPAFIEKFLPEAEVLCVAGDTSDNPKLFIDFYRLVSKKYKQTFLIFGNHDLTGNCILCLSPVVKKNQSAEDSWRWYKWGPYIGGKDPQCEYIHDEDDSIKFIWCYHLYGVE